MWDKDRLILGVVDVMAREHAFTMENYMDAIAEIRIIT
jgi:hypothetical protein